ncbi:hypothetical protein PS685_00574 [Pseudomonas fluorescens]|uniref:Right handed beta helix domain-containing protein n=1 Tax=Pseudomonas fluorescens TaxID=294 RepID=A0A5E6YGQ5_PSEFL|nr:right-handed parallel beta-helix repeat-containing protein [Pseudomonas fluorescens]VVN51161.1 hypothetical protein PS685_00574 [Pseudomonas fluorescens]
MAYNTGNPIGSTSPKDLSDNARNLDLLLLGDDPSYPDRKGVPRKSWKGMDAAFDAARILQEFKFDIAQADRSDRFDTFIESSGWQDRGAYAAGIEITSHSQYIVFGGQPYTLSPSITVPYTTTGVWASESTRFILRGDSVLRQDLASSKGAGQIGINRSPIAAAVGSLAKAIPGIPVSIWEYDHLVSARPNPADPSTWDWTPALLAAINSTDGSRHFNINIPMPIRVGNIKVTGKPNWSLAGGGTLIKITANTMLELYECPGVRIHHLGLNGNILWDEATNGSIIPARPGAQRTAYACGVYGQQCGDLRIFDCDIYDFANDPISIRGKYTGGLPGSAGSTLIAAAEGLLVTGCNIYNYRNTAVYLAGVKKGVVTHNKIYTLDDFGYIRGNGVYIVDWCDGVLCFDNAMDRIGDNGIGVGEVKNPLAQNRHISLISNKVDRSVYMSILIAGGEDVLAYDNTLTRGMMQKELLPEAFLIAGNPGSLQVRGGNTSKANRIRLISNTVDLSYQRGIYVFDDAAITKDNWSEGIEVASNIVRRSKEDNIYVNMANPVTIAFNQALDGERIGIFTSGAHDIFMNRARGNANHGILSSQINTFPGQAQNPTLDQNRAWENGRNGIQVLGGPLVYANPPRPRITNNKGWGNGFLGDTLGSKSGLRANSLFHPTIEGNEFSGSFGPGLLVENCTNYVVDHSNILSDNGWDASLPQTQRAGVFVMCTATAFKVGRLMSNKMFAGDHQQVGYAAEFDTTGSLICIGNEPDAHPLLPQNVARKSWSDIFNNR